MARDRRRCERGQAAILLLGVALALVMSFTLFAALGRALLGKGRYQRATDLAALAAARSMRDDFERLFEPARDPRHLEKADYLDRARATALLTARLNGARLSPADVSFPDRASFAPLRVRVRTGGALPVRTAPADRPRRIEVDASAEAVVVPPQEHGLAEPTGGYAGPFAYRQGKPMRPDVAQAFDRMERAARADGVALTITSAYRSDAEQAELYERHPDPRWVAPPGRSLHRMGTELDLGPPAAYAWLARNAGRFHFVKRYAWEPWHYGYTLNARSTPGTLRGGGNPGDGRSAVPTFVPATYAPLIARAARRWSVSAAMIASQLAVESNFNPFAESPAGAQGIAQFMPGTARAYGLDDPFDPGAAIDAQAHLMRDLLRRFGSVSLALAAYNAGPGAVGRCGCVPPFAETQAYVARVLAMMGGAGAAPSPALLVRLVE